MIKNTNHDGWDCVPELREVVEILNYNDTNIEYKTIEEDY